MQVLQADIMPSLEQLRQQSGQYEEYTKASSKAEQLKRIIVAFDYTECLRWGAGPACPTAVPEVAPSAPWCISC